MDPEFAPQESADQHVRTVREAAGREGIQQASIIAVSGVCPAGIQEEAGIHEEEVEASETIRHT